MDTDPVSRPHSGEGGEAEAEPPTDVAHESRPGYREPGPSYLGRIDETSPVSGHLRPTEHAGSIAGSPEHDWSAAAALISPLLHPAGTIGTPLAEIDSAQLAGDVSRGHSQILVDDGPAGLAVVYALPAHGFDVIVNGEHLVSWRVDPATMRSVALANLASWSAEAPWTDEVSGDRRLLSSETGDGWDAARILMPEVRAHLVAELGASGRILVGLPERHLLVAGTLRASDPDFAQLFAEFVLEHSAGADEPIDRRVFEIVRGELVEYVG